MLSARTFSKPWIETQAKTLGAQAIILEKCIHALELVGRLAEAKLDFVFKGGTSLVLQLQPVRRLSIDVDIACRESLASFKAALDTVAKSPPFTRWEHQDWRDAENPPAKYFRIFYPSPTLSGQESSIQLDILLARPAYADLETRAIRTDFVEVEKPVTVRVPSVDCLLGDKLSAFAPTTIGVLYQPFSKKTGELAEPRPIRVAKQLFDVGELFLVATNLTKVAETYQRIFEEQNRYRGGKFTVAQALDDTVDAAYWLAQTDLAPKAENEKTRFFRNGIRSLNNHLLGTPFSFPQAKTCAARAALAATLIKAGKLNLSLNELRAVPADASQLQSLRIVGPWAKLQKLRNTNIEAFHLWHQASLINAW